MTTRPCERGFTLIELLIVIALLGMVSTIGVVAFSRITDTWRQVSARAELDAQANAVFDAMRRDFNDMVSTALTGAIIRGESDTVADDRFFKIPLRNDEITIPIMMPPTPDKAPQRFDVRYYIERGKGSAVLMRLPMPPGSDPAGQTGGTPIAPGVLAMAVEYRDKTPGSAWQSPWFKSTLPGVVRVSLTLVNPVDPTDQIARETVFPIYLD